jgi:hypothetical protein
MLSFGPPAWVVGLHNTRWGVFEVLPVDGLLVVSLGSTPRGARGRRFGRLVTLEPATGRTLAQRVTARPPRLLGRGNGQSVWVADDDGIALVGLELQSRAGIDAALKAAKWDQGRVWVSEAGAAHFSSLDGYGYRVEPGRSPERLALGATAAAARGGELACHPALTLARLAGAPLLAPEVLCSPHQGTLEAGGDVFVAHQTLLGDEGSLLVTRVSPQREPRWTRGEDALFGRTSGRRVHAALLHEDTLVLLGGEVEADRAWVLGLAVVDGSVRYLREL